MFDPVAVEESWAALAVEATESWTSSAVQTARNRGAEQVDLDYLLDGEPEAAVRVGLTCLRTASGMLPRDDGVRLLALLVVPLPHTETLSLDAPDVASLLDQPWRYGLGREVPGLYVVRTDAMYPDGVDEVYRRTVPVPLPGWHAEYRTWRTPDEAASSWEYSRCLDVRRSD